MCVCVWWGFWLKPLELKLVVRLGVGLSPPSDLSREGRLPQRKKGRLAFLFKEKEDITFLDKDKELFAPVLARVSAWFSPKRVTDVRQRLWLAASEEAQDERRTTHGGPENCDEGKELLKEELPGAESQPLSQQQAQGVQGTSQSHQGPDTGGQKRKENQAIYEATYFEGSAHQQRMAVCKLCSNQVDDTQGVSPVPQNAPRSLEPSASQGGGIGIHGQSPPQPGRTSPRANRTKDPTKLHFRQARPRLLQRFLSRTGT